MVENIAKNLIFIDGIARSGKSLLSGIIPSFSNMEHLQVSNILENIIPSVSLGGIRLNFAQMLITLQLNELAYNLKLSRNVNFRKTDQTGIANFNDAQIYLDRLKSKEGDGIVDKIYSDNYSIPFQTHNLMANFDVVNDLKMDYKIIEMYRNPIDNFYSLWSRGWGQRYTNDPRSFSLLIQGNNGLIPWFCKEYEEEFLKSNEYERCILIGMNLLKTSIKKQKETSYKEKIISIKFEDMVQMPNHEVNRLENFLGKKVTEYTSKFILEANCPRKLDLNDRSIKLNTFKKNVNKEIFNSLIAFTESYERDLYELR